MLLSHTTCPTMKGWTLTPKYDRRKFRSLDVTGLGHLAHRVDFVNNHLSIMADMQCVLITYSQVVIV